jgi:hypothetical protein
MASIREQLIVQSPPARVWDAIADVGAIHDRLARGFVTDTRLEGDTRVVTFANGLVVRELIVDVDHELRRLAYSVIESPSGIRHHHATCQVFDEPDGRSRVVWIADVSPDEAADVVGPMMRTGAEAMGKTLDSQLLDR